jgi:putative transposase
MASRRRRHTPEQIIRKLREGEKQLEQGVGLPEVLKHLEITEATWYRWRNQYGGMKSEDAKRLKELERKTPGSRRWSLSRRWTATCSRSSTGETGEPRPQTSRGAGAAAVGGLPTPRVCSGRPASLHPAPPAVPTQRLADRPAGAVAADRPGRIRDGAGARPTDCYAATA